MGDKYPSNLLPIPLQSGYGFKRRSNKQQSTTTSGYMRQRIRFAPPPPIYGMKIWFTSDQFAIFRGYWRHGINDGVDYTEIPVLTPESKNTVSLQRGRFIGDYDEVQNDGFDSWMISVDFELLTDTVMTLEEYMSIVVNEGADISLFLDNYRTTLQYWPTLTDSSVYE